MDPRNIPNPGVKNLIQIGAFLLLVSGAFWGMITVHAATPHAGAIPRSEMTLIRELIKHEFNDVKKEIKDLKQEIIELRKLNVVHKDN